MKRKSRILLGMTIVSMLPLMANAAGTYYNGNAYQNPQNRYGAMTTSNNTGGYYNTYGAGRGYGQNMTAQNLGTTKNTIRLVQKGDTVTTKAKTNTTKKQGVYLDANLSHEFADWGFEMKQAGSKLHYDNLQWNAINGELAYYFGDATPMQLKVGGKYGMQFGDSPMIDDDVSGSGMWEWQTMIVDGVSEPVLFGSPAMSIGTSNGGSEYGFNAAFGLTDFFDLGRAKVTPSIGYRYFKHTLKTKKNYGLTVDVIDSETFENCYEYNGEIQCGPYIGFVSGNQIISYGSGGTIINNNTGASQLDRGNTYYYEQPGMSHKYETVWMGPYIALDMEYVIDNDNVVNAGLEIGLPIYDSKGDQPYRFDWAHPTSVEDKGDFGDAIHLGFNAEWATMISDSMMFTLGTTYDYYRVSGASATTYLNPAWYEEDLTYYENLYQNAANGNGTITDEEVDYLNELKGLKANGWSTKTENEIKSIYKSMGIRAGIKVKF